MYTVYDWQPGKEYVSTHYGHEDIEQAISIAVNRIAGVAKNMQKEGKRIQIEAQVVAAGFLVKLIDSKDVILERYLVKKD